MTNEITAADLYEQLLDNSNEFFITENNKKAVKQLEKEKLIHVVEKVSTRKFFGGNTYNKAKKMAQALEDLKNDRRS